MGKTISLFWYMMTAEEERQEEQVDPGIPSPFIKFSLVYVVSRLNRASPEFENNIVICSWYINFLDITGIPRESNVNN